MDPDHRKSVLTAIGPALIIGLVTLATSKITNPSISVSLIVSVALLYGVAIVMPQISKTIADLVKQRIEGSIAVAQIQSKGDPQENKQLFEKQHDFIHLARDTAVKCLERVPEYSKIIPASLPSGSPLPRVKALEREYYQLLTNLYDIFRIVIPAPHKIWVSIRDRRSDDQYHTWLRHGSFNRNRETKSQPMHKDSHETVRQLKRHYELQRQCVRITGTDDPAWQKHDNDELGDDRSVLMGAVMTRSWNSEKDAWEAPCLSLILTVNSHERGVFDPSHVPLLQASIDSFSWLTNIAMRQQHQENSRT